MISWFARNSVAANLLMVIIMLGGIMALSSGVRLEIFPFSDPDTVTVSVPLRGATPEDVELGVAVRIEEAVEDLEGIDKIRSISQEGATRVWMEIDADYDPRELLDDGVGDLAAQTLIRRGSGLLKTAEPKNMPPVDRIRVANKRCDFGD